MPAAKKYIMVTDQVQGELWGARAKDWAEIGEGVSRPLYEVVLRKIEVGPATTVLDMGCGAGAFCALAARRGARVSGIDASATLIAIAQQRVPQGDFRVGEIEDLPYADNSFDVVTAFNSIQYAATPLGALKEARRVACPGARILRPLLSWLPSAHFCRLPRLALQVPLPSRQRAL